MAAAFRCDIPFSWRGARVARATGKAGLEHAPRPTLAQTRPNSDGHARCCHGRPASGQILRLRYPVQRKRNATATLFPTLPSLTKAPPHPRGGAFFFFSLLTAHCSLLTRSQPTRRPPRSFVCGAVRCGAVRSRERGVPPNCVSERVLPGFRARQFTNTSQ
jgi:hypothetical protein